MTKCIVLEWPDGSISTRGGFGPRALAGFVQLLRTGSRELPKNVSADTLLAGAEPAELEAARDVGLQWVLDNKVLTENPGATARIEEVTFPRDRSFRAAWRCGSSTIDIDMPKARQIHMDRIREVRDKKLAETDVAVTRALEDDDAAERARLRIERQKLRDIPQTFDLSKAATPDELKALWPEELADSRKARRP